MLLVRGQADWNPGHSDEVTIFNQRAAALGLTITFMILAWLCSLLRLYTRIVILGAAWWDDFFIVLTLLSTTVGTAIFCALPNVGLGRHILDMTIDEKAQFMKVFYVGSVAYPLSLAVIKLALLFQYLRIFEIGSRRRLLCTWLIGITIVWGTFYCISSWVPCYPVSATWDMSNPSRETRHCWGFASPDLSVSMGFYISQSVSTTLLDIIIFLIPLHLFFKADTEKKTRIALLCLFGLGLAVNLCSICRLVYSLKPSLDTLWDLSWSSPAPIGLASIEISLASICASLPVFWPVLQIGWGRIFVTYEVKVTHEYGIFIPKRRRVTLPQTASSDRALTSGAPEQPPAQPEWNPYVGDSKTGLGESETVVESPADRPVRTVKGETFFLV